jgi:hypothetical protein
MNDNLVETLLDMLRQPVSEWNGLLIYQAILELSITRQIAVSAERVTDWDWSGTDEDPSRDMAELKRRVALYSSARASFNFANGSAA